MKAVDAKKAIQDMDDHSQKWHNETEIKKVNEKVYAAQVGCESYGGPHYAKDCLLKEDGKTLEEAYYTQFGVPFLKEDGIEQLLRDSTNETMEIFRIKSEEKQWTNY
ncbi:hypothetical protein Tco_0419899 [Tanacetum coccineum]